MNFDKAFERVVGLEGGYDADPRDRGNWTSGVIGKGILKGTKYGIAAHVYPDLDIKNLTLDQAKAIYRRDYWDRCHIGDLPDVVCYDVFDTAVNSGVGTAIKLTQKALGVVADGVWGPNTTAAVAKIPPDVLDKKLAGFRLMYLTDCAAWPTYAKGWVRRVASNLIED